ncbi:MAG: shikimate 5-dehydrogenase, partial [Tolumonas sp.]|nr:shikimate 5-dehydrogenase [Tolumonas sp.]
AYNEAEVQQAKVIFDVVALPAETPLIRYAKSQNKTVITGSEVFAIQAVEQFALYTGIRPNDELFRQAAKYSRE